MSSTLRQRRPQKNTNNSSNSTNDSDIISPASKISEFGEQSVTEIPIMGSIMDHHANNNDTDHNTATNNATTTNNTIVKEVTKIPTAQKTKEETKKESTTTTTTTNMLAESTSSLTNLFTTATTSNTTATTATTVNQPMTGIQVANDEQRKKKIMTRTISGAGLIFVFSTCVYLGHLYVCGIVALSEFLLFRELVKVRYNAYFNTIQDTIPLFRTTQWIWFSVAIFYTYSDFISEVIQSNPDLHYLVPYTQYLNTLAFMLYSATFVLTIATMQTGHIKFQLNQLCWTIVVLCLTVGQMKYIMHNIFNGLFWFTFPFLLVVVNDIMAYFSGITCGRKFIQRPFIKFSPNKTWEGFIGGGIFTMISAWYLSRLLAQYPWMTCPINEFRLLPEALHCEKHHVFIEAQSVFPQQIFELFPKHIVKMIPGIIEICSVKNTTTPLLDDGNNNAFVAAISTTPTLTRCISGEESHVFHHFELILKNVYPIQIHALWIGFFASVVAPFGGYLASAIKRAYGIKDFDSLIPGHGGVTDRLDCQFLMALCTWVHYNTFVRMATISVPKLVYFYNMLTVAEKQQFIEEIVPLPNRGGGTEGKNHILKKFQEYALSGMT